MSAGSLCAGVGGADLALESLGFDIAWHAEIDPDASTVLAHHWPDVPNVGDIKVADWSTVEPVDVIVAGYPCQPFSTAGRRGGADDPRHLWPAVRRAVAELRPRYVLLENVRGHLTLGFAEVLADLAALGFDAEWGVLGSADVGGCHRRQRLWVAAADPGVNLLPTPRVSAQRTGRSAAVRRYSRSGPSLEQAVEIASGELPREFSSWDELPPSWQLLPTPTTADGKGGPGNQGRAGGENLRTALANMDDGICSEDAEAPEAGSDQALRDLWGGDGAEALQREARGQNQVLGTQELLPILWQHEAGSGQGCLRTSGQQVQESGVRGLRIATELDGSPRRSQLEEQRSGEPRDALQPVPHHAALAGRLGRWDSLPAWGKYAPAVARWAAIFGPPPEPTEPNTKGGRRVNAAAVEWMMGYPAGWVTDHVGRAAALRCIGNAIQPQAAAAAWGELLARVVAHHGHGSLRTAVTS